MTLLRPAWLHRRRGPAVERGASILEFAIVTPLFLLLACATAEFGLVFSDQLALRQSVREAARTAAVASFAADASCPLFPAPSSNETARLMCRVKHLADEGHPELVRVKLVFPDPGGYALGNALRVCAQHKLGSVTNFGPFPDLLDDGHSETKVDMRIERLTTTEGPGRLAPAGETPFAGGWSC